MPDLLTHVLTLFAFLTALSWMAESVDRRMIPVAMMGAGIPDVSKLYLVLSSETVSLMIDRPFSWLAMHRLGPALVIAGLTSLAFHRRIRKRVLAYLILGVSSHFILDLGVKRASGVAPPYLYPLTWWHPPSANIYLSSDLWPVSVAISGAVLVWLRERYSCE